ncbi:MAG: hypothetical protein L6Q78_10880 [Bacteroidia bacterium]|nr:hypothetical protein [Bacteroidia bacterium]
MERDLFLGFIDANAIAIHATSDTSIFKLVSSCGNYSDMIVLDDEISLDAVKKALRKLRHDNLIEHLPN